MALIQQITVPLLAVNDTSLTAVDLAFTTGQPVKKGDIILVFETSKTTFEVEAEANGFVQYLCEAGRDYQVNQVVAKIFSSEAEIAKEPVSIKQENAPQPVVATQRVVANWAGDTLFSLEAINLIESLHLDKSVFKGRDFVSRRDVEELKGLNGSSNKKIEIPPVVKQPVKPALPVDNAKVIV